MQHVDRLPSSSPWRAATFAVALLAAAELLGLLVLAGVRLAPAKHPAAAAASAKTPAATHTRRVHHPAAVPAAPLRPRAHIRVLVLNGNGVSGAAATAADRLQLEGYRIGGTTNARRHDYAQSIVMYVPGWSSEAHRLARDAGARIVTPIDGLPTSQLKGSKLVLLLGT